jgi:hypothetical protein
MASRDPIPAYSVLGLGLSAFAVHYLLAKKNTGLLGGYGVPPGPGGGGSGPGPTIYDPRPPTDAAAGEDEDEDDGGDDGEDGETEDEETDLEFDPGEIIKGGLPPSDDAPPPKPEGGFTPGTPGWVPTPAPPGTPPGGYFPGLPKGPRDGGGVPGTGTGATWTFPIGMKAAPVSGGAGEPVQKMAPMPISAPTPSAGKPGLAGYYDFNGYGALSTERAAPMFQKILVTLSAYFIVAGMYSMAKKRRK